MERNINVTPVSVIKDSAQTYPSGCDQFITFPVIENGEFRVITDVPTLPSCNHLYPIGTTVPGDSFPPATNVLTIRIVDSLLGVLYVEKASYLSAQDAWNNCCSALPALQTPANFTTTSGNAQSVTNWDDVAGATNYILDRSTNIGFTTFTQVYSGATSAYTNTGLTNGTTYYYRVKAQGPASVSSDSAYAYSSAMPALPQLATPTAFVGTPGSLQAVLDWADVVSATNYIVDMATNSAFTGSTQIYSGATSAYTKTALTAATVYYFRVKAQAAGFTDSGYAYVNVTPTA